jgi:hypothetical protein
VEGPSDFNDVRDYPRNLLVEAVWVDAVPGEPVAISWQTPLGETAVCGYSNCLGDSFRIQGLRSPIGPCNDSQGYGENAQLWESRMFETDDFKVARNFLINVESVVF